MLPDGSILVTGAGGFIGGRVVEILVQLNYPDVRPSVRRWATAARIGRYPIEPIQCDLLDIQSVRQAVAGIEYVIHCAVGDRAATVEGTRNLLQAALDANVRRVIHLSTIDVYGQSEGVLDETAPLTRTGREYGDTKIEAEEICKQFHAAGLEVVILRPTIVYGPFSDLWTLEFAEKFVKQAWMLPKESCQGRCNLVHVDDLVHSILLAMKAEEVSGEAFNVNGPDDVTWQTYFEELNRALGLPPLPSPGSSPSRIISSVVAPVRTTVKWTFKKFEPMAMALYKRSRAARTLMKWTESMLRKVPSSAEFDLYSRQASFPADKAGRLLGYHPAVSMEQGVRTSARWLSHHGVVAPSGS